MLGIYPPEISTLLNDLEQDLADALDTFEYLPYPAQQEIINMLHVALDLIQLKNINTLN